MQFIMVRTRVSHKDKINNGHMRLCSILYNKFNYAYLVKNQRFVGPGARPIKPVGRRAFKISGFRAGGPPVEHSITDGTIFCS